MSTLTSEQRQAPAPATSGTGSATRPPAARRIIVTAVLVAVAAYFLVPVYWVVVAATKSTGELFSTNGFWFTSNAVGQLVENVTSVFSYDGGIFLRWFGNSVLYAGGGALVATYLAAAGGYALAVYDFPGKNGVFGLVLGGVLVPATATALPLFLMFSRFGLADSYLGVLLPSFVSPFGFFLCRIYAQSTVPPSLVEAARIDGAGELKIFHTFGLRLMTPALVTVFLFQFVGIWNNYLLPLIMLADQKLFPITLGLVNWRAQTDRLPEFYQLTTGGVLVSVVPLVVLMIVLQRFWQGGLTEGSVKS
ncbi:carbohydrate ABC transporter permease [Kineococcus sp. SYSU DK003]|uniref:carbohydrate ABC transporter permease n=1 Tax=Kineococcus sp. SYSU DK003 TaxID=3383124 RepID=UPI003D7CCD5D